MSPAGIGVEEEFFLVDARTGDPAPRSLPIIPKVEVTEEAGVDPELHSAQIELATPVCQTLDQVRNELVALRSSVAEAAASEGCRVLASGTYPRSKGETGRRLTPKPRYLEVEKYTGVLAEDLFICGCHVHVSVDGPEQAITVLNRARRWTSCLVALAANSPFWEGEDTRFDSFRTEMWAPWPTAGPTDSFADMDEYNHLLEDLVAGGVVLDNAMAYWDIRPSQRYPTVEFRVADVAVSVDDSVLLTALTRALAATCLDAPDIPVRVEMLRAASWQAARNGLSDRLLDPAEGRAYPAWEMVDRFLALVRPALEDTGDLDEVEDLIGRVRRDGNGATRQRNAFRSSGSLDGVIDLVAIA